MPGSARPAAGAEAPSQVACSSSASAAQATTGSAAAPAARAARAEVADARVGIRRRSGPARQSASTGTHRPSPGHTHDETRHPQRRFPRRPAGRRLARPENRPHRRRHRHAAAAALDDWNFIAPQLDDLTGSSTRGKARHAFDFDPASCMAPLPRAYQWADGSAYVNHVELVRNARGAEMPASFWEDPLMYQGGSDDFLGPMDDIVLATRSGASTSRPRWRWSSTTCRWARRRTRPDGYQAASCWPTMSRCAT